MISVRPITVLVLTALSIVGCAAPGAADDDVVSGADDATGLGAWLAAQAAEFAPNAGSRDFVGDGPSPSPAESGAPGDVLVAPIPFADPTIGGGLALGSAYLVQLDPDSPPSTFGAGALYSENDSFAAAVGFKGHFAGDRFRVTAGVGRGRLNFDLESNGRNVPLREDVVGGTAEVLVRTFEHVYVGPTIVVFGVDSSLVSGQDEGTVPPEELDADNYGFGLHALRDTRDSTFYPRTGSLTDAELKTFVPALGNDFSYRILPLAHNQYLSIGERSVLALRAAGRVAIGDVPYYGQSYLGAGPDLRGYAVGTVRADNLLAVQAELRRELAWRIGVVGFAGIGTVLDDLDDWSDAEAYPSVGLGLRVLLEEDNHINFRIDAAWGDGQDAIYVGVGEAF